MIVVILGVAGSGKSTIGALLAQVLGCSYLDADSLHSADSIERMQRGVPLTDEHRAPWLAAVRARLLASFDLGRNVVVGCSALKESYRAMLAQGIRVTWVYLKGSEALIRSRLQNRTEHFLGADLLASQLDTLEEPANAIVVDIENTPHEIVRQLQSALRVTPDVRTFADDYEMGRATAETIVAGIHDIVESAGRCSLVLSGGRTPRPLYASLATTFRDRVPWSRVHLFWGDERYVPHDDPESNYRMARETLLDHVPCPPGNVHPMPTSHPDPGGAARAYEATLRGFFSGDWPHFDLVLLGMGADGHTASLFPGSVALNERERWLVPVAAPATPPVRLTLTLPVLNRATHTHVLVTGADKSTALRRVLTGFAQPTVHPAAAVQTASGKMTWWVDGAAAGTLGMADDAGRA